MKKVKRVCKFCGKVQYRPMAKGYCVSCYQYFVMFNYKLFTPSQYGSLSRVTDVNSNQYGWPICHICGKAYTKLQQHIWYTHKLTKKDYCDLFGIDRGINMTSQEYNTKMSNLAYKYNMPEQLKKAGQSTRFKPGHSNNYVRSEQTLRRLRTTGAITIHKNRKGGVKNGTV